MGRPAVLWGLTYTIARSGQFFLDNYLWQTAGQIRPLRLKTVLTLSGMCLLGVPLAFSSLAIFGISQEFVFYGRADFLIAALSRKSHLLLSLYVTVVFAVIITAISTSLYSLTGMYLALPEERDSRHNPQASLKKGYLFSVLMLLTCVITAFFNFPLKFTLQALGSFYTALMAPLAKCLLYSTPANSYTSLIIGLSFAAAWFSSFYGFTYTPLVSFVVSLSLLVLAEVTCKVQKIL